MTDHIFVTVNNLSIQINLSVMMHFIFCGCEFYSFKLGKYVILLLYTMTLSKY